MKNICLRVFHYFILSVIFAAAAGSLSASFLLRALDIQEHFSAVLNRILQPLYEMLLNSKYLCLPVHVNAKKAFLLQFLCEISLFLIS